MTTETSLCLDAHQLINSDRQADYGTPLESFDRIARLGSIVLEHKLKEPLTAEDVNAFLLLALKGSRAVHSLRTGRFHRDTYLDIAGYAGCAEAIHHDRDQAVIDHLRQVYPNRCNQVVDIDVPRLGERLTVICDQDPGHDGKCGGNTVVRVTNLPTSEPADDLVDASIVCGHEFDTVTPDWSAPCRGTCDRTAGHTGMHVDNVIRELAIERIQAHRAATGRDPSANWPHLLPGEPGAADELARAAHA